ncbi:dipeptidase, partial [Streptosporangium algeriense]
MHDIVLISDPRVAAIPVEETGERLVDVRGRLRVDERMADPDGAFAHLRQGLVARLEEAQRRLPEGYRLLIVEGYRPPAMQQQIFDEYSAELRATFPEMSPEEIVSAASRYVSPVEVAPHTAGAAVDLTLCTEDGVEVDMGSPLNATPEQSEGACYTAAPGISP